MIREITIEEIEPVLSHIWENWPKRTNWSDEISPKHLSDQWKNFIQAGMGTAHVREENGEPTGVLLGLIFPDWHTGLMQGTECLWGGSNTAGLLDEFISVCKQRKCNRVVSGVSLRGDQKHVPALRRLYRQKGFSPVSESFALNLA